MGPGRPEEDATASTAERSLARWLQTRVSVPAGHLPAAFAPRGGCRAAVAATMHPPQDALSAVEQGLGALSLWAWRLDALTRSQAGLRTEKGAVGPSLCESADFFHLTFWFCLTPSLRISFNPESIVKFIALVPVIPV